MSLYKSYVPNHTCTMCGKHIEELEPMWSNGIVVLCEDCANEDHVDDNNDLTEE